MRVHRFYTGDTIKLQNDFWVHEPAMLWQWKKVLRFRESQELILFDGVKTDRLYRVMSISDKEVHLHMVTEVERSLPKRQVYLFWSLLKKDNNDLVLQKCTELGVSNFVPILSERSIRTGFNMDRAHKIVTEASEQCGRSSIPQIREPIHLEKVLEEYRDKMPLYICEQGTATSKITDEKLGIFIGPEGGWSDNETNVFKTQGLRHMAISDHTLRAETASIMAAGIALR